MRRRAFTLIEALVATGILLVVFVIVGEVFSISTNAAGRVTAQAEMIESAAVFEQAVREQVRKIKQPGLLIIESPQPVGYAAADRRKDVEVGEAALPLRHDRLVFIAAGAADEFESVTDRNHASINNANNDPWGPGTGSAAGLAGAALLETNSGHAYASGEALVYFGPGFPDGRAFVNQGGLIGETDLPAKEWVLAQRVILLGASAGPTPPTFNSYVRSIAVSPFSVGAYPDDLMTPPGLLIYNAAIDAVTETGDSIVNRFLTGIPSNPIDGLVQCNFCPTRVTTDLNLDPAAAPPAIPDGPFYRGRAAFNLLPRVADLRIEWTDGSPVDPFDLADADPNNSNYQAQDPSSQWFGQRRDVNGSRNWTAPTYGAGNSSGDVCQKWDWLRAFNGQPRVPNYSTEAALFGIAAASGQVEFAPAGGPPAVDYRVVWTPLTWQFRPKALRFTFRLYDEQDRFNISEVINQTPWANETPRTVKRWGQEFSFVVEVP